MSLFHEDKKPTAQVLLPRPFDQAFTYEFEELPHLGAWVEVPFGHSRLIGCVWCLETDSQVDPQRVKPAYGVLPAAPMPTAQRSLIELIAKETLMKRGEALRLAMPPRDALNPKATQTRIFRVQAPADLTFSAGQQRLLDTLGHQEWERRDLLSKAGVSAAVLQGLIKKGAAAAEKVVPQPPAPRLNVESPIALNEDQAFAAHILDQAIQGQARGGQARGGETRENQARESQTREDQIREDQIREKQAVEGRGFSRHLLDGITGSGKTHVYFAAIASALKAGKQVLWLVPEIALTNQLRTRFAHQFGQEPLIWHSEAGAGAKARTWRLTAAGQPCVVLGARSALHCNFANLGLVIVDEEHEQALKQSDMGTYHARDMAEHRAKLSNAVFLMGSATPSLETEWRTRQGEVNRIQLHQRFGVAQPPNISLLDLRAHAPAPGRWLAAPLVAGVTEALDRGEQAMLFLNRRGYAPLSLCSHCGHRMECHQCTAWMVEHRFLGELQCHLCGTPAPKPEICPSCETSDGLVPCGPGIERLMEEAVKTFPHARIGVFSSDTLRSPQETRQAFQAVQDGEFNLLIGTQVLAKGLDFPNLTLVGVVDADLGLSNEDLRAGERTFQLLHQVTGRAGRAEKPGRAILQTRAPDSSLMQALAAHDRKAFYDMELQRRQAFDMPPFSRLATLMLAHENPEVLEELAYDLRKIAPTADGVDLWGPSNARLALVRGWHRKRFVIRVPKGKRPQSYLSGWLKDVKYPSKTRVSIDIDPLSFT